MPGEEASEDRLYDDAVEFEVSSSRSHTPEDESADDIGDDREADDGGSSSRLNHAPEREALLSHHSSTEYDRGNNDDFEMETFNGPGKGWKETPKTQRFLNNCFRSKCSKVVVFIAAILLAVSVAAFLLRDELRSFVGSHEPVSPQAYILDPNWDFTAPPTRREYTWIIKDLEHNPDGVYRPMIVINGQFPGPLIECNEGDTISVNVVNKAMNATAIHWHGLYQKGTNWMDGTVGITQCPIAPGASFTYEFRVDGQSGTYWYHGHHSVQQADGLVGPLVIHGKDERSLQKIEYASDRVVMVQDHYYDLSSALIMDYLKPDRENAEPVPVGALINGQNIRNCDDVPNRKCDNSTAHLPEFYLEPGKNHRLRFINVGALATFQIQLDEHEFAITEVDGTDVLPQYYHRLKINPAQRYSIIINTNTTTGEAYWLRARMVTHCFAEENPEMTRYITDGPFPINIPQGEVFGIVRYTASSPLLINVPPISRDWPEVIEMNCSDHDTSALHPAVEIPAPATPDDVLFLRVNFEIGAWKLDRGFFNTSSWRAPVSSPTLHRLIDGYTTSNTSFTSSLITPFGYNSAAFSTNRELVYQTTGVRTIDILMESFNEGAHPMHLHGYKFWILGEGHGAPPEDLYDTLDLVNPLRRDTATVMAFGWKLLRFTADNAGIWAFHCHIAWHAEAGLLMQFLTKADEVAEWTLPADNVALCGLEGRERGKGPDDEIWYGHPARRQI